MEYVLKTTNLTKIFSGRAAVNNVSMEIKKGDIYGFIGKNGAGKTTLIRTVVGLASPTSGEMELFESDDIQKGRKKVGTIIENPAVVPHFTARQNMELQAIISGEKDNSEIDRILEIVGLADTGKKKAKNFSLGMRQRLAIALSLLGHPEFLLLDEPINGLDPTGIKEVRDLILNLNKEHGITILISSHILGELHKIATCYGVINNGSLVKQFTAKQLRDQVKSYIKIESKDTDTVKDILEKEFDVKDMEIKETYIFVYDDIKDVAKINAALASANVSVDSISKEGVDPESYFIELMEGNING